MSDLLIKQPHLTELEKQFLDALPEKFRGGALISYRDKMAEFAFASNIEAHKVKLAYMDAFVTAVFMTQKEEIEQPKETDHHPV